jgi:hypothetical protein
MAAASRNEMRHSEWCSLQTLGQGIHATVEAMTIAKSPDGAWDEVT